MSRTMMLSELASQIPDAQLLGDDVAVTDVEYDSRRVCEGALFVALVGAHSDGHDYIAQATSRGAAAVMVNATQAGWYGAKAMPTVIVRDTRKSLAKTAAAFYRNPSQNLILVGVTGTNGKTTTALMIDSIFRAWGDRTAVIGTLGAWVDGKPSPLDRTTPESPDLQRLFASMNDAKVSRATIEVSSEGILQERTAECAFSVGVFTNLTQDHLNTHGTMEEYFKQKLRLFTQYPAENPERTFTAVVNVDDPYGRRIVETLVETQIPVVTYGLNASESTLTAEVHDASASSVDFTIVYRRAAGSAVRMHVTLPFGGLFNVYNAMAAAGAAIATRVATVTVQNGLQNLLGVPGRFERIAAPGKEFEVVVDYAHTPDGLENVLSSARALNPQRLVCVFGCGGDRDKPKRPIMGGIAGRISDIVVVTSDNPRFEDPDAIIEQIVGGIESRHGLDVTIQPDRAAAIRYALCEVAQAGDLIVIAGKGHETTQQIRDQKFPFDDREVAKEVLRSCS